MEQTEEVVRHGDKSEKIDDDLATLLSKARLEHGEYRRFKRQRVPVRGPAAQEPTPMAIGEVAEAPVEKEQPPAARQSKPSRRPLHTLRATFDWIPEASSPGRPRGIGLFSPISGVGCSTLAANLASVLCHAGEQVLLVESSAKGDVALFFGVHHSRAAALWRSPPKTGHLAEIERACKVWDQARDAGDLAILNRAAAQIASAVDRSRDGARPKRKLSPEGLARIREEAQKRRWTAMKKAAKTAE